MVFVEVLIPEELKPILLIKGYPVEISLVTFTAVDVPTPTERLGLIERVIESPEERLCEVDKDTLEVIFSMSPFTWE